ncbi:UNVERIFIED_ORG: hypothetical protein E4P37_03790 [Bacillus sp. AZ43]
MHPLLRAAADRQLGLFTAVDARRAGYAHGEIRHLHSSGTWVAVRRGVYAVAEELASSDRRHQVECAAVLLDLGRPDAALSHATALRLWGLPMRRALLPDGVLLTHPSLYRRGKGFTLKRAPLRAEEVVRRGPLRLTTPARALVDCARAWPLEDAVVAMDAALLRDRVRPDDLAAAVATARTWPGAPRAARAVSLADGRAESPLETRGRLRLVGMGLTPQLQVEIHSGGRLLGVADAWFEEAAVAIEFDGRVKYTDPWRGRDAGQVLWAEKRREDEMRALGIRFVRLADEDLGPPWRGHEQRVRAALAVPGPAVRRFTTTPRTAGVLRAG